MAEHRPAAPRLPQAAIDACKIGVTVATRYSARRTQASSRPAAPSSWLGPVSPSLPACVPAHLAPVPLCTRPLQFGDRAILGYITHQRRLFSGLATTYAMHLAMLHLKQLVVQVGGREAGSGRGGEAGWVGGVALLTAAVAGCRSSQP